MTSLSGTKQANIILFVFLLLATCGSVNFGDNMSSLDRVRANMKKYQQTNVDSGEKPIYTSIKNKQYDKAIKQCEKLREIRPDDHTVYRLEGFAYQQKGEFPSSIDRFSRIINSDKTKGDVYYLRAQSYLWSKKPEKALQDITKALDNKQTPAQVVKFFKDLGITGMLSMVKGFIFYFKAQAHGQLGEIDTAMVSINRAIEYYSTYGPSYELRGLIYFNQNKSSLAYKNFQKAVEINPKSVNTWNLMGLINFYRGNYNEAVAQYQKANQLNPKAMNVLVNMSLAYWLQGNRVKAFEAMGKVLRGKPGPEYFYHYAYFHHLNGNLDKAMVNFKKAYDLNSDILKIRATVINRAPASSPTRKFYQDQLKTAKKYIRTGETPMAAANENRSPTLEITSITLEPDPVPVNQPFDFYVRYKVEIPGSTGNKIATVFYFKVLQNNKILFTSKSYPIKANKGKINTRIQHMNPVPAKGTYTIKAFVKYKELRAEKSIELVIK